jgi:hypothetical protein
MKHFTKHMAPYFGPRLDFSALKPRKGRPKRPIAWPLTLFVLLACTAPGFLQAQSTGAVSAQIREKLARYLDLYPRFKVFLHTDKPFYVPGDTLWYAAYVTAGPEQIPDPLTGVLYVDVCRMADGAPVDRQIVSMKNGRAKGQITLPDSLRGGDYGLRAYTNYMRNFSDEQFFQRRIVLYDPRQEGAPAAGRAVADPDLADCQFFPEGGHALAGVSGRMAFKAVNTSGRGVAAAGCVVSEKGDTAAFFQTDYLGMGFFNLAQKAGSVYKAHVNDGKKTRIFDVPAARTSGYAMSVDNLSNKTNVKVFVYSAAPASGSVLSIVAHTRGRVGATVEVTADKAVKMVLIPRAAFGAGVGCIALFDEKGNPQCERLVFQQVENPVQVTVKTDEPRYKPKGAVKAAIEVRDAAGKPLSGHFSLAVTDGGQVPADSLSDHLLSYLLLSSDVRGFVERPAAYFDAKNNHARTRLDLLLQTQGWRQFDWKEVLQHPEKEVPLHFLPEKNLSYSGKIERLNGKPLNKTVDLTMTLTTGGRSALLIGRAGADGAFLLDSLTFRDTAQLLVQTVTGQNKRDFKVDLLQPGGALFRPATFLPVAYLLSPEQVRVSMDEAAEWQDFLKRRAAANDVLLSAVDIQAKKAPENDPRRMMYGRPENTLAVSEELAFGAASPLHLLLGRVPGVNVNCSGLDCTVQIRGCGSLDQACKPLFMIDGVQVSLDAVQGLSTGDIEAIDVLKNAGTLGSLAADGAINFLTKFANPNYDYNAAKARGVSVFLLKGFSTPRKYYVPRYDLNDAPERNLADRRATVYWNPDVFVPADGKTTVEFFTNDRRGSFRFSVQGMDGTGRVGVGNGVYFVD